MINLWKATAPDIDLIGPDIYHQSPIIYRMILSRYARPDNPLLVVETGRGPTFARFCFYALGDFSAIGFSPFGMDAGPGDELGAGFTDMAANFRILGAALPAIADLQAAGKLQAAVEEESIPGHMLYFDGYDILVRFRPPNRFTGQPVTPVPAGRVLVGQLGPDEFLIAGFDAALDFKPAMGSAYTGAQFLLVEEGRYENGGWTQTNLRVGDFTSGGLVFPANGALIRAKLMRY